MDSNYFVSEVGEQGPHLPECLLKVRLYLSQCTRWLLRLFLGGFRFCLLLSWGSWSGECSTILKLYAAAASLLLQQVHLLPASPTASNPNTEQVFLCTRFLTFMMQLMLWKGHGWAGVIAKLFTKPKLFRLPLDIGHPRRRQWCFISEISFWH